MCDLFGAEARICLIRMLFGSDSEDEVLIGFTGRLESDLDFLWRFLDLDAGGFVFAELC